MEAEYIRIERKSLETFCEKVFRHLHLSKKDARTAAVVLVAADSMGIPSHGVARLWRYVSGLKTGVIDPHAPVEIVMDTPSSIVINANGGMGAPASASLHLAAFAMLRGPST